MRKIILASIFTIASVALAEEVKVTGYGSNYTSALENAKVVALEMGASTFIIGETTVRNGSVKENIDQYNGGTIKRYEIVSHYPTAMGYEVTIVADVVPKNNSIKRGSTPLKIDFDEYQQREKIVDRLDNVGNAIHAKVSHPTYKIGKHQTTIYTDVVLTWQPKWISDMKSFSAVVADKGTTSSNTYDNVSGGVTNSIITRFGLPGALVGLAADKAFKPETPPNNDKMMVCFGSKNGNSVDCNNINVDMSFPINPKLVLVAESNGRKYVLHEHFLDMKMYRYVYPGDSLKTTILSNYKTRFHNPALIVYEQETEKIPLTFNVDNSIIKSASNVFVYLK